jgi:trimeric autotransporter adhesin
MSCTPARSRLAAARLIAILVIAAPLVSAQSILTYAGGGTRDGLQATAIVLSAPLGLATDAKGNLYIAEESGSSVQRVNLATGVMARFAGNGGGSYSGDGGQATEASLKRPHGLAFDDSGNLFIADRDNGRVRRVDGKTGVITTFAGGNNDPNLANAGDGGLATSALLADPVGITWHDGELYIAETNYDANVVRKVDRNGIITTVAGKRGLTSFSGDDGLATDAGLGSPYAVVVDASGNLYIADLDNSRLRRVDHVTHKITTVAGGGTETNGVGDRPALGASICPAALTIDAAGLIFIGDFCNRRVLRYNPASGTIATFMGNGEYGGGDGGVATEAGVEEPAALAFDPAGNLFVEDGSNGSIRRVDAATRIVSTVAGGGTFVGDGRVANAAILAGPRGLAFDSKGNLLIADGDHTLVRRVDTASGVISTFAGLVNQCCSGPHDPGTAANATTIGFPNDLAVASDGNVFIADDLGNIWLVDANGKIQLYAGGSDPNLTNIGDDGPAINASIAPTGIGFDAANNLYIAEESRHRIRKVNALTKIITTIAGTGTAGFSPDGTPAKQAMLSGPRDVVVDRKGNIFISDSDNGVIRRIDAVSGNISTWAGGGNSSNGNGDGGIATNAVMTPKLMAIDPKNDDIYVADENGLRLRKIEAKTQIITTIAGSGVDYTDREFSGDNGPATSAKLNFVFDLSGVAIDAAGNLFISDTLNDRVRVINACTSVTAPQLTQPADAEAVSTSPKLAWAAVDHAFRYDVLLDTVNPPVRVFAADISDRSFTPANLQPSTRYYWSVVAKGDPFCKPASTAASRVASFTTDTSCAAAAFDAVAPQNGTTVSSSPVQLSWQSVGDGATYDVYLGTLSPAPLVVSGITATTYNATIVSGQYSWFVVAHPGCDPSKTSATPTRSFISSLPTGCTPGQLQVIASRPSNGATGISSTLDLGWVPLGVASSYDLYFGTTSQPPLLIGGLDRTSQTVASLIPGTTYFWRVVAKGPCDPNGVTSDVVSFTTRSCAAAGATSIVFAPATVSEGATYAIVWSVAPGLDSDGGYLVERSTSASFSPLLDSQVTTSTAASFFAGGQGAIYHRVRALPGCDPSKSGPVSDVSIVNVTAARPNVIFTLLPTAVVTALGDHLEDKRGSFALENLGTTAIQVIVGRQELNGSAPFFTIVDPTATDSAFVTLEPRQPRVFDIRYAGPSNSVVGSYQGVIFVAATGEGLAVTPYAFVNLKVGGGPSAKPQFLVGDTPADYVAFPPLTGDDATRPPLSVAIRNNGTTPMELAAEIGPEVWLVPDATWNATALAPGATRTVNLFTRRSRAPNGSPLPRYTYFGVRTKDGATARLLVQDSETLPVTTGRAIRLDLATRSFIVPEVVSGTTSVGLPLVSQLRLSNVGGGSVQAELIFTPQDSDGFDVNAVKRVIVIVPANDVVTLTDPLVEIFRLTRPVRGSIEVRLPEERIGLLRVTSAVVVLGGGGGSVTPVVTRGEGARIASPHGISGITSNSSVTTSLTLAETSGIDKATVQLTLYDANGSSAGTLNVDVPAYGMKHFENLVAALVGPTIDPGQLQITVSAGGGSVVGVATVGSADGGATFVSAPLTSGAAKAILARAFARTSDVTPTVNIKTVIPVLATSTTSSGSSAGFKTAVAFAAPYGVSGTFFATFLDAGGANASPKQTITVGASATKIYADVVKDLFGRQPAAGSVFVEMPSGGKVYATVQPAVGTAAPPPPRELQLPTTLAEALTSAASASQRPLFFDGLEQSIDPSQGSRWMLVLNEVGGASGLMNIRLYEPGNRTSAIAENTVTIAPFQQLQLDTVFSALSLDAADRRKDRTNVEVVVTAIAGNARVAAMVVSIDNTTSDTKTYALTPIVGSGPPSVTRTVAIVPVTPPVTRRRSVRH